MSKWRAVANKASFGVYDESGTQIARINTNLSNQQAVAQKLAASPDLYEALERLMKWAAPIAGDNRNEAAANEEIASVGQARAALAKARGEA